MTAPLFLVPIKTLASRGDLFLFCFLGTSQFFTDCVQLDVIATLNVSTCAFEGHLQISIVFYFCCAYNPLYFFKV